MLTISVERQTVLSIVSGRNLKVGNKQTSEYRVLRAFLPVHSGHSRVLALVRKKRVSDPAAWIACLRQPGGDFERRRTELSRGNSIVHESLGCRQIDRPVLTQR